MTSYKTPFTIIEDDLSGKNIQDLLAYHLAQAHVNSPPGTVFALDLDALRQPDIRFWSIWDGCTLLGCGALKMLAAAHGEIKSVRTTDAALGQGVASQVLSHIIKSAQIKGVTQLSLETGNRDAFLPARNLYEKFGFEYCGPFADYVDNPYSAFMTKAI